jgi:hypothetical protein
MSEAPNEGMGSTTNGAAARFSVPSLTMRVCVLPLPVWPAGGGHVVPWAVAARLEAGSVNAHGRARDACACAHGNPAARPSRPPVFPARRPPCAPYAMMVPLTPASTPSTTRRQSSKTSACVAASPAAADGWRGGPGRRRRLACGADAGCRAAKGTRTAHLAAHPLTIDLIKGELVGRRRTAALARRQRKRHRRVAGAREAAHAALAGVGRPQPYAHGGPAAAGGLHVGLGLRGAPKAPSTVDARMRVVRASKRLNCDAKAAFCDPGWHAAPPGGGPGSQFEPVRRRHSTPRPAQHTQRARRCGVYAGAVCPPRRHFNRNPVPQPSQAKERPQQSAAGAKQWRGWRRCAARAARAAIKA